MRRAKRECADPLDHESPRGQPHPDQVPLGHAQRPQRARLQEQRPERVDHLGRDAPLLEQLIVELGQHDPRRRPVGEPPVLLVLAERGDRVQVRGHSEHVVGGLVCAEPVREHPPGQHRRQPHPPVVDQLPCRILDFVENLVQYGVRVGHAAVPQSSRDVVLVQWAVFGQDSRKGPHRVERFRHGDHPMPRSGLPRERALSIFVAVIDLVVLEAVIH